MPVLCLTVSPEFLTPADGGHLVGQVRLADAPRAPSYFSAYFEDQIRNHEEGAEGSLKTLYIDRDPDTFGDICRHLQGESS